MTDPSHPLHPRSPLPDDPEYWERLTVRVLDDAREPLNTLANAATARRTVVQVSPHVSVARPRQRPGPSADEAWYDLLARRASWLAAASLATLVLLWATSPPRAHRAAWLEGSLAPHDPGGELIGGPSPPPLDLLLTYFPPQSSPEVSSP